jgi:hypothetical protein
MLAGFERRHRDIGVDDRDGEVKDDLDLLVNEQRFRGTCLRDTVSLGLGLRTLEQEVRTGDHLDVVEYGRILEIDAADLAATDDADPDRRVIFDNRASLN